MEDKKTNGILQRAKKIRERIQKHTPPTPVDPANWWLLEHPAVKDGVIKTVTYPTRIADDYVSKVTTDVTYGFKVNDPETVFKIGDDDEPDG